MSDKTVLQDLHEQTAKIAWQELQRFFAQGVLLKVDQDHDLIKVAELFVHDDSKAVSELLDSGFVARCSDDDARKWQSENQVLWAVVAAPWVLVQENSSK